MTRRMLLLALLSAMMLIITACEVDDVDADTGAAEPDDVEEVLDDEGADNTVAAEATEVDSAGEVDVPTAEPEPTPTVEPTPTPESTPTPEPTPIPEPEDDPREDPVPFGETAIVGDWEIRVLEVYPNSTDLILSENQFNDPPAEDHQFFIARIQVTYTGADYDRFDGSYSLRAVGHYAVAYRTFSDSCGVIPEELENPEVFTGGTIEGNVCWQIRSSDAESLLMYVDPFMTEDDRQYLALFEGEADPLPELGDTPGEPLDPEVGTRENPVPLGTWVDFGDGWYVRVLNSTPDATQMVLDANQFNDEPADGNQFFIVEIEASYFGSGSDRFDGSYRLRSVGPESVAYSTFSDSCGVIPNELDDPEVFPGGVISGNVCWQVRSTDADSLIMFEDSFLSSSERIYMALE
jgi:hypothetical protein